MKKLPLLFIGVIISTISFSQFTYKIKADSLLVTNDSCNAELNLENSTKDTLGFLYNKGRGRTEFRRALKKLNDSSYVIGSDTLHLASASALTAWKLTGNSGTNPANHFIGTTDNTALNFRVNNGQRFSLGPITTVGSYNINYITAGDPSPTSSNPVQFIVYGKDISGSLLPFNVNASIAGMTWSPAGGTNNTIGRLVRWTQWTSTSNNQFYDQGIDQEGDFFITERGLSGTGGSFPKKMLQISGSNNIGLNMSWTENPTANFHTKGTVRHEGHVGIGDVPSSLHSLNVAMLENTVDGRATAKFASNDIWQTNVRIDNTTSDKAYSFIVGGTDNTFPTYGVGVGNFGITKSNINGSGSSIPFIISQNDRIGMGAGIGGSNFLPKAALDVASTNSGILIPRLTTTLRNSIISGDLHNGLLLYNTDSSKFEYYNGSIWKSISNSSSGGGGTLSGGNLGAGHRIYVPSLSGTKTLFSDITGAWDSTSNANALTYKVDTSYIATQNDLLNVSKSLQDVTSVGNTSNVSIKITNGGSVAGNGEPGGLLLSYDGNATGLATIYNEYTLHLRSGGLGSGGAGVYVNARDRNGLAWISGGSVTIDARKPVGTSHGLRLAGITNNNVVQNVLIGGRLTNDSTARVGYITIGNGLQLDSSGVLHTLGIGGAGDVFKVGTPANNQIGVWTGDGTIKGSANLTFNGENLFLQSGTNSANAILVNNSAAVEAFNVNTTNNRITAGAGGLQIRRSDNNASYGLITYDNSGRFNVNKSIQFTGGDQLVSSATTANNIAFSSTYSQIFNTAGASNINHSSMAVVGGTFSPTLTRTGNGISVTKTIAANAAGQAPVLNGIIVTLTDNTSAGTVTVNGLNVDVSAGTNSSGVRNAAVFTGGNVSINAGTSPSEKLHVSGNIRFSGALMPNNAAGTSGYHLASAGTGNAPTWVNPATKRVSTTASSSTITPNADANDMYAVTALSENTTFAAPSGTLTDGQQLLIRIKDNGTARTLSWNTIYRASDEFALPGTTTANKTMYVQFVYNAVDNKLDCIGLNHF